MSLLAKFTVTPLLYACGVLLAALIASGIYTAVLNGDLDTARAEVSAAQSARDTAITERGAWKQRAAESADSIAAHQQVTAAMRTELERVQGEAKRLDAEARKSIAAANAEAQDADRTLARMAAQFQAQARQPDCTRALAAVAAACPAFRGY